MKRVLFALAVMIPAVTGCQSRTFISNAGRTAGGNKMAVPTETVESFAKQQGISREEALEYFRNGQTLSDDSSPEPSASSPDGSGSSSIRTADGSDTELY